MASKYFLYARKSQERDDRQVVSLEDQVREMKLRASKQGLHIVEVFEEAKSIVGRMDTLIEPKSLALFEPE